jgi:hypothetical protein
MIKAELVFVDTCMREWCTKYCQRSNLHAGWEALFSEGALVLSPCAIHIELLQFEETANSQTFPIPNPVVLCIIYSLLMLSNYRASQAAFLITLTETMLLPSLLSTYVRKYSLQMWGICTRDRPSMDFIALLPGLRQVRAVKWMWAISCITVSL